MNLKAPLGLALEERLNKPLFEVTPKRCNSRHVGGGGCRPGDTRETPHCFLKLHHKSLTAHFPSLHSHTGGSEHLDDEQRHMYQSQDLDGEERR